MTTDGFEATFRLGIDRTTAWQRLTSRPLDHDEDTDLDRLWLPGFDSAATVVDADAPDRLQTTKDDEPCAGTDIVVTLTDEDTGTRIHVVQSRFGDQLPAPRDLMAIGWRHIVADLHTFLATGVHAHRHVRRWGDLGATATALDGGLTIGDIQTGGLADRLGLADGDLLTTLAGAPITTHDDLDTVLRVIVPTASPSAEWVREGTLHRS
ncbi:MAG: SRPBCC domain-containing protein [Acidimicrobiales bacterium]